MVSMLAVSGVDYGMVSMLAMSGVDYGLVSTPSTMKKWPYE
jgi:hypothetical protein